MMKRNRTLAKIEAVSTKANTDFQTWWDLLDKALAKSGLTAADFSEASGCYEMGECPETAVAAIQAAR